MIRNLKEIFSDSIIYGSSSFLNQIVAYIPFIMFLGILEGVRFTISTGFELSERQKMISVASSAAVAVLVIVSILTLTFYPPYSFFIASGLATLTMAGILLFEARKIMIIDYPFFSILFYTIISVINVALLYNYKSMMYGIVSIGILFITTIGVFVNIYSWKRIGMKLNKYQMPKPIN